MPSDPLPDVVAHYEQVNEDARLNTGCFQLEFARSKELIQRRLPPAPAKVLDVGGGSGRYALWLAGLGYEIHLIDPVPKHIEQARLASESQVQHPIASMRLGDARKLEFPDDCSDAVLLLGPLYHLTERADRLQCLREARRELRRGGVLFAAAISRFASLLAAVAEGLLGRPEFMAIVERDLQDGQHRNETGDPLYFTTAYFHRPAELEAEIREAGFKLRELVGIEGPGWMARNFDAIWASPEERDLLMRFARTVEAEPELIAASAHLLAIAEK